MGVWPPRRMPRHHDGIYQQYQFRNGYVPLHFVTVLPSMTSPDPEGLLFFNDIKSFKNDEYKTTRYNIYYNNVTHADDRAVVVQFFHTPGNAYFAQVSCIVSFAYPPSLTLVHLSVHCQRSCTCHFISQSPVNAESSCHISGSDSELYQERH